MRTSETLAVTAFFFSVYAAASSGMGGPEGPYAASLAAKLDAWMAAPALQAPAEALALDRVSPQAPGGIALRCVAPPAGQEETFLGAIQAMRVNAPLERVQAVLDDFGHYADLFPDLKSVKVVSSQPGGRFLTAWEQKVPVFFIPNVKFEMDYAVFDPKTGHDRRAYRYQLHQGGDIRFDDGMIVLERDGASTRYYEYDFWDANYGLLKSLGVDRIRKEGLEGLYVSDVAVKLRAEKPELSYENIRNAGKAALKTAPIADCLRQQKPWPEL